MLLRASQLADSELASSSAHRRKDCAGFPSTPGGLGPVWHIVTFNRLTGVQEKRTLSFLATHCVSHHLVRCPSRSEIVVWWLMMLCSHSEKNRLGWWKQEHQEKQDYTYLVIKVNLFMPRNLNPHEMPLERNHKTSPVTNPAHSQSANCLLRWNPSALDWMCHRTLEWMVYRYTSPRVNWIICSFRFFCLDIFTSQTSKVCFAGNLWGAFSIVLLYVVLQVQHIYMEGLLWKVMLVEKSMNCTITS